MTYKEPDPPYWKVFHPCTGGFPIPCCTAASYTLSTLVYTLTHTWQKALYDPQEEIFCFLTSNLWLGTLPTLTNGEGLSVRLENSESRALKRVLFHVHIPFSPDGFSILKGRGQYLSPTSMWSVAGSQQKEAGTQRAAGHRAGWGGGRRSRMRGNTKTWGQGTSAVPAVTLIWIWFCHRVPAVQERSPKRCQVAAVGRPGCSPLAANELASAKERGFKESNESACRSLPRPDMPWKQSVKW